MDKEKRTLIIDTETTGLDADRNEILQLSIIDNDGNVLFDKYFKPKRAKQWRDAEAVNHISPDDVADKECIDDSREEIESILQTADKLVGYNLPFDLDFIRTAGISVPNVPEYDVMREFAVVYGDYNEYFGDYKWQKLTRAARYYHYNWDDCPAEAHNSLADCFATLFVYKRMTKGG